MRNVSAKCQQLMCTGVPVDMDSVPDTDIFGCFGEVHNALQCIACKYEIMLDILASVKSFQFKE